MHPHRTDDREVHDVEGGAEQDERLPTVTLQEDEGRRDENSTKPGFQY